MREVRWLVPCTVKAEFGEELCGPFGLASGDLAVDFLLASLIALLEVRCLRGSRGASSPRRPARVHRHAPVLGAGSGELRHARVQSAVWPRGRALLRAQPSPARCARPRRSTPRSIRPSASHCRTPSSEHAHDPPSAPASSLEWPRDTLRIFSCALPGPLTEAAAARVRKDLKRPHDAPTCASCADEAAVSSCRPAGKRVAAAPSSEAPFALPAGSRVAPPPPDEQLEFGRLGLGLGGRG